MLKIKFIFFFLFWIVTCRYTIAGTVNLDFSNYRVGTSATVKIVGGQVSGPDFSNQFVIRDTPLRDGTVWTNIVDAVTGVSTNQFFSLLANERCPTGWNPVEPLTDNDLDIFAQWVNQYISQPRTLVFSGGGIPSYTYYKYPGIKVMLFQCYLPSGKWISGRLWDGGANIVVPPPQENASICTLNSQNLSLNYSSVNLNVEGLTQNANLIISCTNGDAGNYQLKLTGNNVTNGRLNFGNGVSAQISLNGTQVQANGDGISLKSLTNGSIPVNAILKGSASGPGTTNANGVLVLSAL